MTRNDTSSQDQFDELFDELLRTTAEQHRLSGTNGRDFKRLIDIRDRLHLVRSELAAARLSLAASSAVESSTGEAEVQTPAPTMQRRPVYRIRNAH